MGNRATPPKSFNTVKHSNRKKRLKRLQWERIILLSIFCAAILLILSLAIFGICAIVDAIGGDEPQNPLSLNFDQTVMVDSGKVSQGELILINSTHYFDPANATELKTIFGNQTHYNGIFRTYDASLMPDARLHEAALNALNQMMLKHYEVSDGDATYTIRGAYRTAQEQEKSDATLVGRFDHHSGYTVAIRHGADVLSTDDWLYYNAHKYGFVVRYPDQKSDKTGINFSYNYCFRYVGVAHATYMYENNLCLEEYVSLLKSHSYDNPLAIMEGDTVKYAVYYVPASGELTTVKIPSAYAYSISGNNDGGFIITIDMTQAR